MACRTRPEPHDMTLFDHFAAQPDGYQFFQAMRVIEAHYADSPRMGEARTPREDPLRIGQAAELAFPTSAIQSYDREAGRPDRLINRFFGLFGPHGPLPLHLTKYARNRSRNQRDGTLVAFADMLTHRFAGILHRAWAEGQPAASYDRDGDLLSAKVSALSGHHGVHLQGRDALPDDMRRHFTAHLAMAQRTPEGLLAMIGHFFAAPVRLQEFVGGWLDLEPDDTWQLGRPARLGQTTSIGQRVWSRAARFRLIIGPLSRADYEKLLPGGASFARLQAILRAYVGSALECEVNLVLSGTEVPRAVLSGDPQGAVCLGYTSWLYSRDAESAGRVDATDLYLLPVQGAA